MNERQLFSFTLQKADPLFCFFTDKFWYCRLSPNHKVLHYGDLEESSQGEVPHDSLQEKREYSLNSDHGVVASLYKDGIETATPCLTHFYLLSVTVPVADIKAVVTGKDCPHMKEKGALKQNKVSPFVCAWWESKECSWISKDQIFILMHWCVAWWQRLHSLCLVALWVMIHQFTSVSKSPFLLPTE